MDSENAAVITGAIFVIVLTLGAWLVRGLTRETVETSWDSYARAESPVAYWFWAVYHVVGMAAFLIALVAVVLYYVADAFAEDRLRPEDSILGGRSEYAVALRKAQGGGYSIVTVSSPVYLWTYEIIADEMRKTVPADWHDVKAERCEIALAALDARSDALLAKLKGAPAR